VKQPVWIEEPDVHAIHERVLALHGGAPGVRNRTLLQSALARPQQHYACSGNPKVIDRAVLYTAGIVRNHPFLDGNKRTGFVIGVLFLELNGYELVASEEDATHAVLALAAGTLTESGFKEWMWSNVRPSPKRRSR